MTRSWWRCRVRDGGVGAGDERRGCNSGCEAGVAEAGASCCEGDGGRAG